MIINKYFYLNPLFILFTDANYWRQFFNNPENLEEDYDPFNPSVRQMGSRNSASIEIKMIDEPRSVELRERFKAIFQIGIHRLERMPIALITFVLSIFIAIDPDLRQAFYVLHQGKIPAITQFCLNTFRMCPVSNSEYVTNLFSLDEYWDTISCCGLGNTIVDQRSLKNASFKNLLLWFSFLNNHFTSKKEEDEENYLECVEFNRVPFVSMEKNYLCGLTVENGKVSSSENSYFNELSNEKKASYIMLAKVLDCVCVPEDDAPLPFPHKNFYERNLDENKIVPDLIIFIVTGCKDFLDIPSKDFKLTEPSIEQKPSTHKVKSKSKETCNSTVTSLTVLLLGVNFCFTIFEFWRAYGIKYFNFF